MRKPLVLMLALVVATSSAGVVSLASAAPNIQTITGSFLPKKLPEDKRAPIALFTDVSATNPGNPFQVPNATTLAKVDYDKDGKFQQKGLPTCDPGEFTSSTTIQDAKDSCSDALVGGGGSIIKIPVATGAPPITVDAEVAAFNGARKTLVLHTQNSLSGGQTLVGKIAPSDPAAGSQYGITLTVPVPPLAGGAAVITQLDTRVKKVYNFGGKRRSLLSARCRGDHKLRAQARFTDDQGQLAVAKFVQNCQTKQ